MVRFTPIAQVQNFTNNNPAVQGIKQNGTLQARLASQSALPTAQAPVVGERRQALAAQAAKINAWGQNMTSIKQQGIAKKQLVQQQQALEKAMQEAKTRQAATPVATSGQRSGGGSASVVSTTQQDLPAATGGSVRSQIVRNAQSMLGTPYAWGGGGVGNRSSRGTGKGTQNVIGVDCSGLTSYVYGLIGVKLPRKSDTQLTTGVKTSIANAQPGDLVGWGPGGHVAIYAGNGQIIEAPKPGGRVQTRTLSARDRSRGVYAVRLRLPGE